MGGSVPVWFYNIEKERERLCITDKNFEANVLVIHGLYTVFVMVPKEQFLVKAYKLAMASTGLFPEVTEEICEEMITMLRDKLSSWPQYQANYGQSFQDQPSSEGVLCPNSML